MEDLISSVLKMYDTLFSQEFCPGPLPLIKWHKSVINNIVNPADCKIQGHMTDWPDSLI